jgi:hypothetical protein
MDTVQILETENSGESLFANPMRSSYQYIRDGYEGAGEVLYRRRRYEKLLLSFIYHISLNPADSVLTGILSK